MFLKDASFSEQAFTICTMTEELQAGGYDHRRTPLKRAVCPQGGKVAIEAHYSHDAQSAAD
jgi:hypothetical protein